MSAATAPDGAGRSTPIPAVSRMPVYLGALTSLTASGRTTASSEDLARTCGVGASIVRRDLSLLNFTGRRGVGYDAHDLADAIRCFLGIDRLRPVGVVGAGRLGTALAHYLSDPQHGFSVQAVFDAAPSRIGQPVGGLTVTDIADLQRSVDTLALELLVIAVPAAAAQTVVDAVAGTSIRGLLNFAPVPVRGPAGVEVRHVDLATELQVLSHFAPAHHPHHSPGPLEAET
nr:redox-sensing transcriptional repressor Rex [Brevibacterium yomogidense]